jgi:hypothetical protein
MKVHITSTSEVDQDLVSNVIKLLNSVSGVISFCEVNSFPNQVIGKYIGDFENTQPIDFDHIFSICNYIRNNREIPQEDYLVLFTSINITPAWFSSFDPRKNIFISVNDWNNLTNGLIEYAIGYQVVGNIFHTMLNSSNNANAREPLFHTQSIGCISDYCIEKTDILLKFRTAYICRSCLDKTLRNNENNVIHIHQIIQELRKEFIYIQLFQSANNTIKINIDKKLNIFIGEKEIKLRAFEKTIYLFFITNLNGITTEDIYKDENRQKLLKIYDQVKTHKSNSAIISLCNRDSMTFQPAKSKINTKIFETLGAHLSKFFIIDTIKNDKVNVDLFKINVDLSQINIDELAILKMSV